jgi:hypothetical protein
MNRTATDFVPLLEHSSSKKQKTIDSSSSNCTNDYCEKQSSTEYAQTTFNNSAKPQTPAHISKFRMNVVDENAQLLQNDKYQSNNNPAEFTSALLPKQSINEQIRLNNVPFEKESLVQLDDHGQITVRDRNIPNDKTSTATDLSSFSRNHQSTIVTVTI